MPAGEPWEQAELLQQWLDLGELWRDLEYATLRAATVAVEHGGTGEPEPPLLLTEEMIPRLAVRAEALGIDRDEFAAALTSYLGGVQDSIRTRGLGVPPRAAHELVAARRSAVSEALALSPPGVERTQEVLRLIAADTELDGSPLEAWADASVDPTNAQRTSLAGYWRELWQDHREHERQAEFSFGGQAFWRSRDGQDVFDDVAYYRVYERYRLHEFDELFDDVAKGIGEAMVEATAAGDPLGRSGYGAALARAFAENLWLVSRSQHLRRVLHVQATSAVAALYHLQDPAGWWPAPYAEGGVHPPSATATAMAMIAGRRISRSERHREQRDAAAQWLIGAQNTDGSWPDHKGEPDVLATAVALNALAHSGRPGLDTLCQRAADWLLSQQRPHGLWDDGQMPNVLLTVVVLEAFRSVEAASVQLPATLRGALSLVTRSQLLVDEHSGESRQLAVIAAYTGLEGVLYALLSQPSINVATTRPNGRLIGLDDALKGYEAALVAAGTLAAGHHVDGHHVLRTFTRVRDSVVHGGAEPSPHDAERIVAASVAFCRKYIPPTFGLDPLAD